MHFEMCKEVESFWKSPCFTRWSIFNYLLVEAGNRSEHIQLSNFSQSYPCTSFIDYDTFRVHVHRRPTRSATETYSSGIRSRAAMWCGILKSTWSTNVVDLAFASTPARGTTANASKSILPNSSRKTRSSPTKWRSCHRALFENRFLCDWSWIKLRFWCD